MVRIEKHDSTLPTDQKEAPGAPGAKAHWTSSAKTAVGTATAKESRVWFTFGQGVLNEIYFPDVDRANTRRVRFLVTDGQDFFSDEQFDADHHTEQLAEGVPAYQLISTCKQGRYRLEKKILTKSVRDTLLLQVQFHVLDGSNLKLFLDIEPHLADQGAGNTAWVAGYKGLRMLVASRASSALAAFASVPIGGAVAGFVGAEDGYAQLKKDRHFTTEYNLAKDGNVTICGELVVKDSAPFVVAIAFGSEPAEAAQQARAGVLGNFDESWQLYRQGWQEMQANLLPLEAPEGSAHEMYRISTAVLRTHESKRFPGAFVASLSLPWGFARGDEDTGAYHVLWPRDLCETAMGLMACGDDDAGRRALFYLACTQEGNGSWSQNMWLDGTMHWGAIQMDGISMPVLLADQLRREGKLEDYNPWPMVMKAVQFLLRMGPGSEQDRWESLPGYSSFTMAVEVAALLAAADFADSNGCPAEAYLLRETADAWNDHIDQYLYATGTDLCAKYGVEGYYLRIAPPQIIKDGELSSLEIQLGNHTPPAGTHKAVDVVSPDALDLTRYGLRAADDPRMIATAKVIDGELKKELPTGPGWTRSTDDGYGEHADGSPYNGTGIGRCWPLLAGERGHFELAAGRAACATELLRVISRQTSACGMIPEQVWDVADITEHKLFNGHPAGSGMPLAWAHAEYVKLLRSVKDGKVYDMPPQTVERYQKGRHCAGFEIWNEQTQRTWVTLGKALRMAFREPATVHWSTDDAPEVTVCTATPVLQLHIVKLILPASWKNLTVRIEGQQYQTVHLQSKS